jgi:tRNA-dihydrouridine synthase A
LNGGLQNPIHAAGELGDGPSRLDGAMLGRAAYQNPQVLCDVDTVLPGEPAVAPDWEAIIETMVMHADRHIAAGGRLAQVTRHMVGLFAGLPGARRWRQILSVEAARAGAGGKVILDAFDQVRLDGERQAA